MYIYISIHPSTLAKGNNARRLGGLPCTISPILYLSLYPASQMIKLDGMAIILDFLLQTYLDIPVVGGQDEDHSGGFGQNLNSRRSQR